MKQEKSLYVVGGCVRDIIMKRVPKDIDMVAVGYTGEELIAEGLKPIDADFPVFLNAEGNEVALARREKKSGDGYRGFETDTSDVTLEEDLMRRDLTINSIAIDVDGNYVDPFGGVKDIENKILKHTSDAFFEDPLRVLRLARFQAEFPDFKIHRDTVDYIRNKVKHSLQLQRELRELTGERIYKETVKAMGTKYPSLYFRTLKYLGVLKFVYPELSIMTYRQQNPIHHAEGDIFQHSMMVLDECAKITNNIDTRFGALYHDIAKPFVDLANTGRHYGHDGVEFVDFCITTLKNRYKLPNKVTKTIRHSALFHMKLHKLYEMNDTKIAQMFNNKAFPKTLSELEKLLNVTKADARGRITIGYNKVELNDEAITNTFKAIKAYTPKYEIEEYKEKHNESPKTSHIHQMIHKYSIKCVQAWLRPVT